MVKNIHCLRPGTRLIGHYVIYSVLGQGGFGITYMGMDELHQTKVAIKEYFPQGIVTRNIEYEDAVTVTFVGEKDNYNKGKEKFLKEARIMAMSPLLMLGRRRITLMESSILLMKLILCFNLIRIRELSM